MTVEARLPPRIEPPYRTPFSSDCWSPYMTPLSKSTDATRCRIEGHLFKSLQSTRKQAAGGRHFLFDQPCEQLQVTRTLIPPLPRHYQPHCSGNLHPIRISKDLSPSPVRPLSLSSCEAYELRTNPSFLLPSALVLNKRNTFSVTHCQLNRPKVTQRTYNLLTMKDVQKGQASYPDPMAGAPYSFVHRVSELSSMEWETARQEKLRKMSKNRKPES